MLPEYRAREAVIGYPTKIATCCHCGSKAALTLGRGRHELSCASCGAPLKALKMLPTGAPRPAAVSHQPRVRQFAPAPKPVAETKRRPLKRSKRKAWLKDWAEEVFDLVEDIFD